MDLAIYGAQAIALGAYRAISSLYPQREVKCFLVSQMGYNASVLAGLPVREIASFAAGMAQEEKDQTEVLIAAPENVMDEIEMTLEEHGMRRHVRLTSLRWAQLMGYYYVCEKKYMPLAALPVGYHKPRIHAYMAKFYRDKPLSGQCSMPAWVIPIQVGSVLCEERVADILDCEGENISAKNGNYCELTALYWIWKNCLMQNMASEEHEYYGLMHYRRILDLSEDDVLRLSDNQVDVVLPYPMPYEPDIKEHHKRYLRETDWNALLTALAELQPEYAEAFPGILEQQFFYNYNMILARKEILAGYCSWLFPILERIELLSDPRGCDRSDRYIGYMGETLETLYFTYNQNRFHIAYAGCRFLV